MGWLKKAIGFENSFTKNITKDLLKKPQRLLTGIDPLSTKISNTILNRDDRALVNMLGSPDEQYYQKAAAEGVDVSAGRQFHAVADMVAASYGANGLGLGAGGGGLLNAASSKLGERLNAPLPDMTVADKKSYWNGLPESTKNEIIRAGVAGAGEFFKNWSASEKAEWERDRIAEQQKSINIQPRIARYTPKTGLLGSSTQKVVT